MTVQIPTACDHQALLMQRFPEIGFFLSFAPFEPLEFFLSEDHLLNAGRTPLYSSSIQKEVDTWFSQLKLEGLEILYVYGLGLGYYFLPLKKWLKEQKGRKLIFLEDDIAVIDAFLKTELSKEILETPEVHIQGLFEPKMRGLVLEELAQLYPCDRLDCTALESYKKRHPTRFQKMRLMLLRSTAAIHALLSEALYSHKIFANLVANLRYLPEAFYANQLKDAFKGVPAVICGAGPSLKKAIPSLKTLENRALIIAGGSAIAALSSEGVLPHLAMALDPNHEEWLRLLPASAFEVPLLYSNRVLPDIFLTTNGPKGYLRSDTGGIFESWMEQQLEITGEPIGPDLGKEAFSVTTLAVAYAYALGCNPILFAGVDLAFTGQKRYAEGVVAKAEIALDELKKDQRATERLLRRKDRQGKPVYTLLKWVMEAQCIGAYAEAHPERLFLNVTEGGMPMPAVADISIEEAIEQHCDKEWDLRAEIHSKIQPLYFPENLKEKINSQLQDVKHSLERCLDISSTMLIELENLSRDLRKDAPLETGKMVVLEMDFEEELAFTALLQVVSPAIDRIIQRFMHSLNDPLSKEYRKNQLECKQMKWQQLKDTIESFLKTL